METVEITLEDVLKISSGADRDGDALCAGSLSRESPGTDPQTLDNVFLDGAVFDIHSEGGCVAVEARFRKPGPHFVKAKELLLDWQDRRGKEDVTLLLSPYLLNGSIFLLFQGLANAWAYIAGDEGVIVMAFDHDCTAVFETEGVDYSQVLREVEAELKREEDELYSDLEEARAEESKARSVDFFDFGKEVEGMYDKDPGPQAIPINKCSLRSGKSYTGIRIARRGDDDEG